MKDYIDRTIQYLPILSVILIFFSAINLHSYYIGFNISIFNYLEISELPILIFEDIILLLFVFLPISLMFIIEFKTDKKNEKVNNNKLKILLKKNKNFRNLFRGFLILINLYISLVIVNFVNLICFGKKIDLSILYFLQDYDESITKIILIVIFLISLIFFTNNTSLFNKNEKIFLKLISIFILIACFGLLKSSYFKGNDNKLVGQIMYNKKRIFLDNNISVIGQSKNYIFLYNKNCNSTRVIFKSLITEIYFRKLEKTNSPS